jgi:hypothetical protein
MWMATGTAQNRGPGDGPWSVLGGIGLFVGLIVGLAVVAAAWGHGTRFVEGSVDKWLWTSRLVAYGDMFAATVVMFVGAVVLCVSSFLLLRYVNRRMAGRAKTILQVALGLAVFMFGMEAWTYASRTGDSCRDEDGNTDYTRSNTYYVDKDDGTANYYCVTPQERMETLSQYAWRP